MEASKGIQKGEKASDIKLDAEEMATGTVLCKREENEGKGRQWWEERARGLRAVCRCLLLRGGDANTNTSTPTEAAESLEEVVREAKTRQSTATGRVCSSCGKSPCNFYCDGRDWRT